MDCNKEEAIRAKDVAIKRFAERDYIGAHRMAVKAHTLAPELDGVPQMLIALQVYATAEQKINGEMDLYGLLDAEPDADDMELKKKHKKMMLKLHPDKNQFVGASGAFQLVQEAYNILSDKVKRDNYNARCRYKLTQHNVSFQSAFTAGRRQFPQKFPTHGGASAAPPKTSRKVDQKVPNHGGVYGASRTAGGSGTTERTFRTAACDMSQQKVPSQSDGSTAPPRANGHHKSHTSTTSAHGKPQKSNNKKGPSSTEAQGFFKKGLTFWTACTRCKMQYEYMRGYINQQLKCPTCQTAFQALEIPPPSNMSTFAPEKRPPKSTSSSGAPSSGFNSNYAFGGASARWSPVSGTTAYANTSFNYSVPPASGPTCTSSVNQCMKDKGKREREEASAAAGCQTRNDSSFVCREGSSKKARVEDGGKSASTVPNQAAPGVGSDTGNGAEGGQSKGNPAGDLENYFSGPSFKPYLNGELSHRELRKMLADRALLEIRNKLKEWKSNEATSAAKASQKSKVGKITSKHEAVNQNEPADVEKGSKSKDSSLDTSACDTEQEGADIPSMAVPDADFHEFDLDRTERFFGENQVWASYDDNDGMPRYYAFVQKVISLKPFKARISWLGSRSTEFGLLDWVERGFIKACGEFRIGKYVTNDSLNSFSHKVEWVKGPRGVVQIYPQKGEIWALYRNWSPDWDKNTPNETRHAYDMVEILSDYNEEQGISVAPLCKAAGFRSVFCKQQYPKEAKRIPKEEMFRFSHRVPSHVLTGEEKPNAPKGYVELDPAATPSDLLQVIPPANGGQAADMSSSGEKLGVKT